MSGISFSVQLPTKPISSAKEVLSCITAEDPEFRNLWKEFLSYLPLCGYRHLPEVFEYYKMLSQENAMDVSFIVKNREIPIAICPLVIESFGGKKQASYSGGGYLPLPLLHPQLGAKQRRALESFVFDEATKRLEIAEAKRWLIECDILSIGTDALDDQFPSKQGALDVSINSHLIDLTLPDEELWGQLRHSAKSTINAGLKTYEFFVYDEKNFTFEIGERHRLLHHKCAGRVTRPIATFHKMYSWVAEGSGLMFEQKHDGVVIQMIFVVLGKNTASGASAADDPEFAWKVPITHSMNYFIYKETQRRGIRFYDVGETTYRSSLFRVLSDKEQSICDFKRGFGKQTLPWKRWIWFSDVNEELAYLDEQMLNYRAHLLTESP